MTVFLRCRYRRLSDAALSKAKDVGCSYAEVRVERIRAAYRSFRDHAIDTTADHQVLGLSVRVVHNGVWGFASDITLSPDRRPGWPSVRLPLRRFPSVDSCVGRARR
jgi:TldD protein